MSCGWPFHHDQDCQECEQWEQIAGMNLDQYLKELDEKQHAARAARRKTTPPTGTA